jgi:hypothetical protein
MATSFNNGALSRRLAASAATADAAFKKSFDQRLQSSNPQIVFWQPAAERALAKNLITAEEFAMCRRLINDGWSAENAEYHVLGFVLTR